MLRAFAAQERAEQSGWSLSFPSPLELMVLAFDLSMYSLGTDRRVTGDKS